MDDVKALLKRVRRERHELRVIQESASELRGMLLPAGIRYDKDKVQTSPEEKMSGIVADLIHVEEQQGVLVEKLRQEILIVEKLIGSMQTPEYRELIRLRFITGGLKPLTWEEVADKMEYSADHVRGHLYDKAITEAERVWSELKLTHHNTNILANMILTEICRQAGHSARGRLLICFNLLGMNG